MNKTKKNVQKFEKIKYSSSISLYTNKDIKERKLVE